MFCLAACVVQSLLPQGKMKRMAVFACGILFTALFMESAMLLFQNVKISDLWTNAQGSYAQTTMEPNDVYARQMVRSILGENASCNVFYDEHGNMKIEISSISAVSGAGMQSIKQALCGIYDIEEGAIRVVQGR